jgi:hypothetical protein
MLLVCLFALIIPLASRGQDKQEAPHFERFPIVDFTTPEPSDQTERAKRAKKGKKYNVESVSPLNESVDNMYLSIDWDASLPALPVERSAAVVIERITNAEAYLSENRTAIYSEFTVRVEAILKNEGNNELTVNNSIFVYRTGGRLRFPSGKILISAVSHQDMPEKNGRYVLFLTHLLSGGEDEDLHILTGYELKGGRVFPLDTVLSNHPMTKYTGVSEHVLLTDLSSSTAKSAP